MKRKLIQLLLILTSTLFSLDVSAQASGDYVATSSGDYNTAANWSVSNGSGGFTGTASSAPTTSINVWIPEGINMTNSTAAANAKNMVLGGSLLAGTSVSTNQDVLVYGNLTVLSTGVLKSTSANAGYVGKLRVGTSLSTGPCTLQIDGQLGSTSGTDGAGSGFRLYFEAGGTTTVKGSGKFNLSQIRTGEASARNQNIIIDMDINLMNTASNGRTLTIENGNASTATKTLTINEGRTVNFSSNSGNSVVGGQTNTSTVYNYTGGNMLYNIQGTLNTGTGGGFWLMTTSNTTNSASINQTITIRVGPNGKLIVGPKVHTGVAQPSTQAIIFDFQSGSQVEFAGSVATTFSGSTTSGAVQSLMNSFSNLKINNSGGVTFPAAVSVDNLTVNAGSKLTTSGNTTATTINILSTLSGTGTLINGGTLTNTSASVQQYLPDARNWYVSSPVTGAVAQGGYTYYQRDETASSWTSRPFVTDSIFLRGHGYIVLPTAASTLQFNGTLNSGDVNVYLTKSGSGFNLIGNPYPSHLTWTADFVDDLTNAAKIEPTIWIRTNAGNVNNGGNAAWSFLTYNGHSGEAVPLTSILTGGIIPPMQAFWVKAKAAGTLTLDSKLVRSHQSSNPLKVRSSINTGRQRIRMEISDGSTTDETLLYFDGDASDDLDAFDSPKFTETKDVQLYTRAGNENLVINGLNSITDNMVIPLGIITGQSGTFTLKPTQLDNLASDTRVFLVDGSVQTELELNKAYTFSSDATENSSRFSLLFKAPSTTTHSENLMSKPAFNAYRDTNGQLVVTVNDAFNTDSKILIYNLSGQKVSESTINGITTVINQPLKAGVYFVTVSSAAKNITQKVVIN